MSTTLEEIFDPLNQYGFISGGPGVGKSTTLTALMDKGALCLPEAATHVIARWKQMAKRLPWQYDSNSVRQRLALRRFQSEISNTQLRWQLDANYALSQYRIGNCKPLRSLMYSCALIETYNQILKKLTQRADADHLNKELIEQFSKALFPNIGSLLNGDKLDGEYYARLLELDLKFSVDNIPETIKEICLPLLNPDNTVSALALLDCMQLYSQNIAISRFNSYELLSSLHKNTVYTDRSFLDAVVFYDQAYQATSDALLQRVTRLRTGTEVYNSSDRGSHKIATVAVNLLKAKKRLVDAGLMVSESSGRTIGYTLEQLTRSRNLFFLMLNPLGKKVYGNGNNGIRFETSYEQCLSQHQRIKTAHSAFARCNMSVKVPARPRRLKGCKKSRPLFTPEQRAIIILRQTEIAFPSHLKDTACVRAHRPVTFISKPVWLAHGQPFTQPDTNISLTLTRFINS